MLTRRLTLSLIFALSLLSALLVRAANKPQVASHPTKEAEAVYQYLCGLPDGGLLSGQAIAKPLPKGEGKEIQRWLSVTGKRPAILSLDIEDGAAVVAAAKSHWQQGGLVSLTWNWGAPTKGRGREAMRTEINLVHAITPGTPTYQALSADVDRAVKILAQLRDAGVPVLWRPFHQFNSSRFWWGKGGPEQFKELWRFLFERLSHQHQLDNLIWVLGYNTRPDPDWYPGDEYVDFAGAIVAEPGQHERTYRYLRSIVGFDRPVSLHETIVVPDAADLGEARWRWFVVSSEGMDPTVQADEAFRQAILHERIITLDEVPPLGRNPAKK